MARAALYLTLALAGCRPAPAPTTPNPDPPTMTSPLAAALARAADGHEVADLRVTYSRGHELAGTTTLELDGAGRYTLRSNVTAGRRPFARTDALPAADRAAVFRAIAAHRLLALPSSSRVRGDDELPVIVTVAHGDDQRRLLLWQRDAVADAGFHAFEGELLALLGRLSDGAILSRAD